MNVSGTITAVVPDGNYVAGSGKTIFTYQMSIDDGTGNIVTGQIGSVKNIYPAAVGSQIEVISTTNQHGTSFKKAPNPQFANQNQGGGRQQQNQGNSGGGYSPPSQEAPDWDAIARGKCFCAVICAAIQSKQVKCTTAQEVEDWVNLMMAEGQPKA